MTTKGVYEPYTFLESCQYLVFGPSGRARKDASASKPSKRLMFLTWEIMDAVERPPLTKSLAKFYCRLGNACGCRFLIRSLRGMEV